MRNKISEELFALQKKESVRGMKFPRPYYLFWEKYGRSLKGEMDEICGLLKKTAWFEFDTAQYDSNYADKLKIEVGKQSMLGKGYDGCLLISIAEGVDENELIKLMEYIKGQEELVVPVFSVKCEEEVERIKSVIERYHYCRIAEGEEYTAKEQTDIIRQELEECGFELEDAQAVLEVMEGVCWDEKDRVENTLKNVAKQMIYEEMIKEEEKESIEGYEFLKRTLYERGDRETKHVIGFVMEG